MSPKPLPRAVPPKAPPRRSASTSRPGSRHVAAPNVVPRTVRPERPSADKAVTAPIAWLPRALTTLAGLGLVVVLALAVSQETAVSLKAPGGLLDAIGRVTGLVGSYMMLIMIVLSARVTWLERSVGQDRLLLWHRRIGGWPIALIAVHIVTIVYGYAAVTKSGVVSQFLTFIFHYPNILASFAAFGLFVLAGITSYRAVRRQLKYETWWIIHLYIYLALTLAFAHQITNGIMFKGHAFNKVVWTALWISGALTIIASRIIVPIVRNRRWQLRVDSVKKVAPGVVAITLRGRGVASLAVAGGQFFQWRFMAPGLWWHSHPYSLSAMPRPPLVRVTVKASGDQSAALAHLKRGTRVLAEGPYGKFTRHALVTNRVTLIGAGVGITPIRALLEDLSPDVKVAVVVRARRREDLVHADEISALVKVRQGEYHELVGSRHEHRLTPMELRELVPHISHSDAYVCGPAEFTSDIVASLRGLGLPVEQIHTEEFSF